MTITEAYIQQECYIYFQNTYARFGKGVFFSIPNELAMGIRSALLALKLNQRLVDQAIGIALKRVKNTGFLTGVSDTIIVLPNSITLYIEFKTSTGYQSQEQKDFQATLTALGHHYFICRSLDEFKKIIATFTS